MRVASDKANSAPPFLYSPVGQWRTRMSNFIKRMINIKVTFAGPSLNFILFVKDAKLGATWPLEFHHYLCQLGSSYLTLSNVDVLSSPERFFGGNIFQTSKLFSRLMWFLCNFIAKFYIKVIVFSSLPFV